MNTDSQLGAFAPFGVFLFVFAASFLINDATLAQPSKGKAYSHAELEQRLKMSGANELELRQALDSIKPDHRKALVFLIQHMPESDLKTLSAVYLLENVRLAYEAIDEAPWGKDVPESIFLNDILPYANLDETREDWRTAMRKRCLPIVKDCQTPGEAAQKLNRELFALVNVRYSTSRKKANQSPSESMEQSVASCTGLSILLSDACRSVGVPARLAGIPSWANKRGNHTWVEIWDGQWHFTGAAEPSDQGLNHAWFTSDAALARNDVPKHRIYATSFSETGMSFPMVWAPNDKSVPAVNVTDRYVADLKPLPDGIARVYIRVRDAEGRRVKRLVRVSNSETKVDIKGTSRDESFDTNDLLTFELPRNTKFQVEVSDEEASEKKMVLFRKSNSTEQVLWDLRVK